MQIWCKGGREGGEEEEDSGTRFFAKKPVPGPLRQKNSIWLAVNPTDWYAAASCWIVIPVFVSKLPSHVLRCLNESRS